MSEKIYWLHVFIVQCSVSCGMGTRDRILRCGERRNGQSWNMESPNQCRNLIKPNSSLTEVCKTAECPRQPSSYWNVSPWSQVNLMIYYSLNITREYIIFVKQRLQIDMSIYPLHSIFLIITIYSKPHILNCSHQNLK